MQHLEKFRLWTIGLSAVVIIGGLGLWVLLSSGNGSNPFGGGNSEGRLPPLDFANLTFDSSGNVPGYLLCDVAICPKAKSDALPPILYASPQKVRQHLAALADTSPTVRTLHFNLVSNQFDFLERLPGETIPSVLSVRLIETDLGQTRLAIYSHKPLGESEKSDHTERVIRWVQNLKAKISFD